MASSATRSSVTDSLEYYNIATGHNAEQPFKNLDDPENTESSITTVQNNHTSNFVLDFSDAVSWVAFDLDPLCIATLLDTERPEVLNTRWINIWYPSRQKPLLELLARKYDFSPRLLALMSSEPARSRHSPSRSPSVTPTRSKRSKGSAEHHEDRVDEHNLGKASDELSELSCISSYDSITESNLYRILNDLWTYNSVDYGRLYTCVGYNSLYGTKYAADDPGEGPLPYCTRVWTWLVLCEDNTVIVINEDPFPFNGNSLSVFQQRIVTETKRNLVNVFRSLAGATTDAPMAQLPIRARFTTTEETAHRSTDIPGLLFYYLFENWQNSYTLVTRRESRYGRELSTLRKEMFESPKLCHIDRLDSIGKELGILKRHYASYNRIIDRLLEPPSATVASLQNSRIASQTSQTSLNTIRPVVAEKDSMLGVSLSSAARVRFKRLRDLIDLYALSEVEEYIKQKEALVTMNFNLIAIKESLDVERLTRLTLLLTKITMIFLPVSLMTGYFSVQLANVDYTVTQFWTSFVVVLLLSCTTLFIFGLFSGTVQTFEVLRGLKRGLHFARRWMLDRL